MSPSQIIVLATPVFLALIAIELAVGIRRQRNTYHLADAVSSISLGALSQTSAVFTRLLRIGIYTALFEQVALWRNDAFWTSLPGWLLALVFYDFCYYWLHRMGHESAVLWAAHAVHHQSQDYNLGTALRQTSSGALLGWVFYVPMALAGVPPLVFGVVALIDLLYQFWVHTEQVGRLGWFDRWFCSPSNHRVHHAVNDAYLDKNYGGILILWDRLFGTFKDEDAQEKCVYGTRGRLDSWDPVWANAQVYAGLAHDSWHARRWGDKLRVWLKPPGWRPADVAERFPKPAFDIAQMPRFNPAMAPATRWFACVQFALLLAGISVFLWHADSAPLAHNLAWFAALLAVQWALGAVVQGRIGMLLALMIEAGALATATSAVGWTEWHWFFKPLAMVIAIILIAFNALSIGDKSQFDAKPWATMVLALVLSLAGDVFLMRNGFFIPGLVSFLGAHLAYIALFRRGVPWFAHRGAMAGTLAVGAAMYAFLWAGGLPAALRGPVAAYVLVIALMAAQALGRAQVLGSSAARKVAAGACFFMLSDSLLATHRFVQALPMAQFWVLSTYYAAQMLIVWGWLRNPSPLQADATPGAGAPECAAAIPAALDHPRAVATRAG
ncbi:MULTISPECIES: lysoplasmalogenase family protein [Acidovorax]|uniref:Sterol desaturase/sphingolipid hydroxylase, fatty acid hydroxylase superfamily n=1 Tax=Acidovorax soli TaxID=592050 RepID=A0A1H3YI02_9BURK|nr:MULTISPECIES: lysoplasmalogenase family protein [Acidovorax]SEA11220.1 Sterol desaturase/sphingolipid hydroxylase, fatty acid hydroxylase superfamily [Acidovorax soli]